MFDRAKSLIIVQNSNNQKKKYNDLTIDNTFLLNFNLLSYNVIKYQEG